MYVVHGTVIHHNLNLKLLLLSPKFTMEDVCGAGRLR